MLRLTSVLDRTAKILVLDQHSTNRATPAKQKARRECKDQTGRDHNNRNCFSN